MLLPGVFCVVLCYAVLCVCVCVCVRELGGVLDGVSWRFVVYERNKCHLIRFLQVLGEEQRTAVA
jgi:hypothetical protein